MQLSDNYDDFVTVMTVLDCNIQYILLSKELVLATQLGRDDQHSDQALLPVGRSL